MHAYMASPSGTSSGYSSLPTCEIRKRKRMLSNRESARRSRMRKKKHFDDLMLQVTNLTAENDHIVTNMNLVAQLFLNIDSENSVLRAQISELNHRLHALNDIITCMSLKGTSSDPGFDQTDDQDYEQMIISGVDDFLNPCHFSQPIIASDDVFMCSSFMGFV